MALGELVSRSQIPEGGVVVDPPINGASASASERKKVRESERRRRRRKPKKNDSKSAVSFADYDEKRGVEGGEIGAAEDERNDYPEVKISVEVEYVPERADVDESIFEEFKNVLEKFNFRDHAGVEDDSTKDETMGDATAKKGDSDTEEDEQETQQKEKGLSNKKKKVSNIMVLFAPVQFKLREMKPGMLSRELKEALGMPDGAPPPWLINMQIWPCVFSLTLTCDFSYTPLCFAKVLEEKEERIAPGTLLGTTHT
ncbi:hypothetical protein B296_00040112 [Ensete ventricosum]|uniref:PSP proline-rich domain-containing protein n=1 Tax=Ensete ventricosum TaxID=4639 RepID=A0A426ZRD0_ENSVE|nr:hypothetical protein B296_00040112 [Ensete ventricosum]